MFVFIVLTMIVLNSTVVYMTAGHVVHTTAFLLFILFNVTNVFFLLSCACLNTTRVSMCTNNVAVLCIFTVRLMSGHALRNLLRRIGNDGVLNHTLIYLMNFIALTIVILGGRFVSVTTSMTSARIPVRRMNSTLMNTSGCNCMLPFRFVSMFLLTYVVNNVLVTEGRSGG